MRIGKLILKTISAVTVFLGMTMAVTSCMDADPTDPPIWLGSWHLETMAVNGEPDTEYNEDPEIMASFEGNVFNLAYIERAEIYGSWSYAGETLTLIASYNAGSGANVTYLFNPFPVAMKFPEGLEEVEITVTSLQKKRMQWQYIDKNGDLRTCDFVKFP